jgi:hypothetical protein
MIFAFYSKTLALHQYSWRCVFEKYVAKLEDVSTKDHDIALGQNRNRFYITCLDKTLNAA